MSLDPITVWPQRYVLKCQPRKDLDENLGTLPDYSIYVGSSSGLTHRLCYHFTKDKGTLFTKRYEPEAVQSIDMRQLADVEECLRWEDELVIDKMMQLMSEYSHPEAWRCVAGGSWSKPDNLKLPEPLRRRLQSQ